jgi:hypothetical protein
MTDLVDRPEWVSDLLEISSKWRSLSRERRWRGADIIGLGDAVASQVSRRVSPLCALTNSASSPPSTRWARWLLHICGDTSHPGGHGETSAEIIDVD